MAVETRVRTMEYNPSAPKVMLPTAVTAPEVDKPALLSVPVAPTLPTVTVVAVIVPVDNAEEVIADDEEIPSAVTEPAARKDATVAPTAVRPPETDKPEAESAPPEDSEATVAAPADDKPLEPTCT